VSWRRATSKTVAKGDKRLREGCAGRLRLNRRDMRRHTTSYRSGGAQSVAVMAAWQGRPT